MATPSAARPAPNELIKIFGRLLSIAATAKPEVSVQTPLPEFSCENEPLVQWLADRKIDSAVFLYGDGLGRTIAQSVYDAVWRVQRRALSQLLEELELRGLAPLVVKGGDAIERYFNSRGFGLFNDIDLLVEENYLQDITRVLLSQDYRQAYFDASSFQLKDRSVRDIAAIEAVHYELPPFCKLVQLHLSSEEVRFASSLKKHPIWVKEDGTVWVVVEFDVHFGLATDVDSAQFFARARPGAIGARSMSATDAVWFGAARYYMELALHGKNSLRDMFYVAAAVKREEIDWDLLLRQARELENAPAIYYPLSVISWAIPDVVPVDVLQELSPVTSSRDRDFGWQLSKLFDFVDPLPWECTGPENNLRFDISRDMQPLNPPQGTSRSVRKRLAYSIDPYFKEGWEEAIDYLGPHPENHLHDKALIVFKPEAVVGRRIRPGLQFLQDQGFKPLAAHRFRYSRDTIRVAWQYQLNIASRQRLKLVDLLETATDSLCVLLQKDTGTDDRAATEILSELKGPSDPRRRHSYHLRATLGMNALLINYVHTADEVADLARELAIYADPESRKSLWTALKGGVDETGRVGAQVELLELDTPAHDLDFNESLARLRAVAFALSDLQLRDCLLRQLEALSKKACPADWESLQKLMDAANVSYELWDLIIVAAYATESNRQGLRAVLG